MTEAVASGKVAMAKVEGQTEHTMAAWHFAALRGASVRLMNYKTMSLQMPR